MAVKDMLQRKRDAPGLGLSAQSSFTETGHAADIETEKGPFNDDSKVPFLTVRTFFMAVLVSFGGLCFGFDTGQISGFLQMEDFEQNFADQRNPLGFGNLRSGLIVGMVCE